MHVDRTITLACETIAKAEVSPLGLTHQMRKRLNLFDAKAGDFSCPLRCAGTKMCFQPPGVVGVAIKIIPVGKTITEQNMHDSASESTVGTGFEHNAHIRLSDGGIGVDVDDDDLGTAVFSSAHCMGHHIDLCGCSIGAPDDNHIGLCHLARVWACQTSGSGKIASPCHIGAETVELVRVTLGKTQAIDGISLHQPHCTRVIIGPDAFTAICFFGFEKAFCNQIKRRIP